MSPSKTVAVGFIIVGILAFIGGQQGVYYYRDEAFKQAEAFVTAHESDYHSGDLLHALDRFLEQTRFQRAGFYAVQFGGFILACWGASRLRRKPETL